MTELADRLRAIRAKIVASGARLLTWDEIDMMKRGIESKERGEAERRSHHRVIDASRTTIYKCPRCRKTGILDVRRPQVCRHCGRDLTGYTLHLEEEVSDGE